MGKCVESFLGPKNNFKGENELEIKSKDPREYCLPYLDIRGANMGLYRKIISKDQLDTTCHVKKHSGSKAKG